MKRIPLTALFIILTTLAAGGQYARAVTMADYTSAPPFIGQSAPPLVMMVMGRDHKLYYEAYNDASDLDGDGQLDVGYKHSIDYYGYFDSYKCYDYTTGGTDRFIPVSTTTDKYCASGSGYWSGNFLNWLSMSRMDAVRKVFYGGYRSTDSSSTTVLEGAFIPQDAHSWGKEYYGADTPQLTPFSDTSGTVGETVPSVPISSYQDQKILLVTYDDSATGIYGNDHSDLINSYSLCGYQSYSYINDFNYAGIDPSGDHIDTGNFLLVTYFEVTSSNAGTWDFAVDGDDGVEIEIDGTVVASWYGAHGACNCQTYNGSISLSAGWHTLVVRHRENNGEDGVKIWYRRPGMATPTWTVFGTESSTDVPFRAPDIPAGETSRLKHQDFLLTGIPGYDGSEVCSTKNRHLFCVTSLSDGSTPVIRVLQDSSSRAWDWASKEGPVCDTSLGSPTDYYIRVTVCDGTVGRESNCRQYPNGSNPYKPVGLFQKYGESEEKVCSKTFLTCNTDSDCGSTSDDVCMNKGQMFYGLITGTYTKNLSGGVVRWNIDSITHDVDNSNVGIIQNQGILKTLNNLRVLGFDYGNYAYGPWQWGGSYDCGWLTSRGLNEGECRMWGNPIAEMMYEGVRYFAGKTTPTSDYAAGTGNTGTDDDALSLPNQSDTDNNNTNDDNWIPPYNKYPSCSKPFMIVLSDVSPSYDSDQLPGVDSNFGSFTGDLTGLDVSSIADTIGSTEGINGGNAFIGQSGGTTDSTCSSKSVSGLGSVRGLCPEEPTKKGSYYSAAVAYYGKELFNTNNGGLPDITTYSVALQSPVPDINIDVNGDTVKLVPIGKSVSGCVNIYNNCDQKCTLTYDPATGLTISSCASDAYCPSNQIVDFYVDTLGTGSGKFRINFEDVEQGADHDMDAIAEYNYCVGANCSPAISANQVKITLDSSVYASGCIDQTLGFVISGTTEDGVYLPVKDDDTSDSSDGDTPSVVATMPRTWTKTFTVSAGGSTTTLIKNPLWYAAKWGGFEDQNNNDIPDLDAEWDKDGDGVPDTYYLVTNPLEMEQKLTQVFADILKRSASGTSVSILATSAEGEGSLYQAYFYPEKIMTDGTSREWLGYCRGLFLDAYGNLREDSNGDGKLIFSDDRILRLRLDLASNEVKADLFDDSDENGVADTTLPASTVGVDSILPLWEGGEMLAKRTKSSRNIYVWVDSDNDGIVDNGDFSSPSGEAQTFTNDAAHRTFFRPYLRGADDTETGNIIDFIRGNAVSSYRNRCIPISGAPQESGCSNANERVWALGDIIYSTPTTVAKPKEQYDLIYGSNATSYRHFRSAYNNRRQVVYVGGNDGMLHAFNAGVYTAGDDGSTTTDTEHGWFIDYPPTDGWGGLALGEELWAFIPHDNLPHLKWLTQPDYSHVYYTDLKPKPTDVRIFCDSDGSLSPPTAPDCVNGQSGASHPGGWGTILIVGMRLGGGAIDVTDDFGSGSSEKRRFQSAYYVLDVTDPERKPKLLWRFTDTNLGFSTTYPGIAHIKNSSTGAEKWFMVVGSGPDNFEPNDAPNSTRGYDGSSNQDGKIFIVDLLDGSLDRTFTTDSKAFMGDPTVVDGDLDYTSDVIYIGNAYDKSGNPVAWTNGKVYRINTNSDLNPNNWTLSTLLNYNGMGPVLVGPSASKDSAGNLWVFFGSGRFWSSDDKVNSDQQRFYGFKDACWKENSGSTSCSTTYTLNDLVDSTNLTVCASGAGGGIYDSSGGDCSTPDYGSYTNYLTSVARPAQGWYIDLTDTGSPPSERVLSKSVVLGGIVLFTAFTPDSDICSFQGDSALYALYYETGTAYIKPVIGTTGSGTSETINKRTDLGKGMPTTIGMAVGKSTKGFIQTSTGTIVEIDTDAPGGRSGPASWRESTGSGVNSEIEEMYRHIVK